MVSCSEFRTMLPPGVHCVVATPAHFTAALHAAEEACLAELPPHSPRRAEFRAGRACAREALAYFGVGHAALLPAPTREPNWPAGIVGSITHTRRTCAVAVARRAHWNGIGIDIEACARIDDAIADAICSAEELRVSRRCAPQVRRTLLAVLFSAKESVFKALFPLTRVFLEFGDVELVLDAAHGRFRARATRASCAAALERIEGRFAVGAGLVHSAALLAA